MPLTSKITVGVSGTLSAPKAFGTLASPFAIQKPFELASGTGADQADKVWTSAGRTLAPSANEDLDLAGSLVDDLGATITFARIRGLYIAADPTNANNLIIGNAAANGFISWVGAAAHTIIVKPGGLLLLVARDATAYPVTAGTGDLLRVTNSAGGTSVKYDIALLGASA
jgi:hypothetical protein